MTEQDLGLLRWDTGFYKVSGLRGNQAKPLPQPPAPGRQPGPQGWGPAGVAHAGGRGRAARSRHSPVGRPAPSPLSPPSLLGSPGVRRLPLLLQALAFLGALGGREGPRLLICLEVPLEKMDNAY